MKLSRAALLLSGVGVASSLHLLALRQVPARVVAAPAPLHLAARPHRHGLVTASASGALEEQIKEQIAASSVVVYSKSWCPFCQQTKATLDSMSIEYTAIELDELDAGADIQAALLGMTQQRTVPNVFVKGAHLGGNDDTQRAARDGRLAEMLK